MLLEENDKLTSIDHLSCLGCKVKNIPLIVQNPLTRKSFGVFTGESVMQEQHSTMVLHLMEYNFLSEKDPGYGSIAAIGLGRFAFASIILFFFLSVQSLALLIYQSKQILPKHKAIKICTTRIIIHPRR